MESKAMAVRERNWAQSIHAAEQSGMSPKAWCAAHGVCPSTFYRWKRSLKDKLLRSEQTEGSPVCTFAELECPGTETYAKTASIDTSRIGTSQAILLHAAYGTLEISADCSEEQLCRLLQAVRHAW